MTTLRKAAVGVALGCLGCMAVGWTVAVATREGAARDKHPHNYDKIRAGMSLKEVEGLLGGPCGWYREQPPPLSTCVGGGSPSGEFHQMWYFGDCEIVVWFSRLDRVQHKSISTEASGPGRPSWIDKLKANVPSWLWP